MTYKELVVDAVKKLKEAKVPDAAFDVKCMVLRAADRDSAGYYLMMKEEVSEEALKIFNDFIKRRLARQPLQLILGDTEFMGLPFIVDGKELIPRQDTEVLVEIAIKLCGTNKLKILDLFTGSGCIAISLAHFVPYAKVFASDISQDAVQNAKTNAAYNFADVDIRCGDMFEPFCEAENGEAIFDIITANPPYIKSGDIDGLMPEVKDYDPLLALDGGADGLTFYRRLALESLSHLKENGRIIMEIGCDQGLEVCRIFEAAGYRNIKLYKDYAGLDRVVTCEK